MRTHPLLMALVAASAACAAAPRAVPRFAPLSGQQAEVRLYLAPLAREAAGLRFRIESISLRRNDGTEVPLEVVQAEISGADAPAQRLVAQGRVPPGDYAGVAVKAASATLQHDDERNRLLVAPEPAHSDAPLTMTAGATTVVWVTLRPDALRGDTVGFSPSFQLAVAPQTAPQSALYATETGAASVTVIDRRVKLATGAIPVGAVPRGIALDRLGARAYVSLGSEDRVQIIDTASNKSIDRIQLRPGDRPRDLAIGVDGTLLALNEGSRTVSFLDVVGQTELARAGVGDAPVALVLDRGGRRAFVPNRASSTLTVLDVAARSVIATIATDPEPLYVQISADGSRLYVVHRGSAHLSVFALPSLAPLARAYLGLGATTLRVDSRTGLLYLSRAAERRIVVYDPVSLQPVDQLQLPAGASYLAIDDAENTLLALLPDRQVIAVLDLTSRKLVTELPVGSEPFTFAFIGERP